MNFFVTNQVLDFCMGLEEIFKDQPQQTQWLIFFYYASHNPLLGQFPNSLHLLLYISQNLLAGPLPFPSSECWLQFVLSQILTEFFEDDNILFLIFHDAIPAAATKFVSTIVIYRCITVATPIHRASFLINWNVFSRASCAPNAVTC